MVNVENDPFTGTWKLKSHQSQPKVPPPQSWNAHIEAGAESIRVREEIIAATGQEVHSSVDPRFDGQDYAVHGSPQADAIAYTRTRSHSITGFGKKNGKIIWSETVAVSADGQTLTLKFSTKRNTERPRHG